MLKVEVRVNATVWIIRSVSSKQYLLITFVQVYSMVEILTDVTECGGWTA